MPDIRLQDYSAKIKDLNKDGLHDEAIAHCQHILRYYPKYIEAYCLLGEACLEKGMYREAIEFFQRTLSADPENSIARVGLGIIYGEQAAFPEAIWQMERAFELAPGNAEVRRELQRLYAQRDGAEKPRLKLTRGALGRLYARNGLYERAINEFRTVLRQDSDLPDIRVALLEALWREGRRLEAVEIALDLLEALPNCLKANLILGEIWTRGGHEDAGEEKLELANALDPENRLAQAMMGRDTPLKAQEVYIPELTAIPETLEIVSPAGALVPVTAGLEMKAEEPEGAQPEEAAEAWEAGEEMPDWLLAIRAAQPEAAIPAPETRVPTVEPPPPEEVPEWLRELVGEEAGPLPTVETPVEEVAPAEEVPEWLQEVVSHDEILAAEEAASPPGEVLAEEALPLVEMPDWLHELEVSKAGVEAEPLAVETPPSVPKVPDSLKALVAAGLLDPADLESAMLEMSAEELEAQEKEEVPDWLKELMGEEAAPIAQEITPPAVHEAPTEEIPVWPGEAEVPTAEEVAPSVAEEPAAEMAPVEEVPEAAEIVPLEVEEVLPVGEAQLPAHEMPESLKALVAAGLLDEADLETAIAEMSVEELEAQKEEEIPDWLKELMGEEVAPVAEEITSLPIEETPVEETVPAEEIPAWLGELAVPEEEWVAPTISEEEETPAWLGELAIPEEERGVPTVSEEEEIPAWLGELAVPEEEQVASMEEEEVSAWLHEWEAPEEEKVTLAEEIAPPAEGTVVAPVEQVKEEEAVPPSRLAELSAQVRDHPRDYKARLEIARLYHAERDWNAAMNHYEKLIAARKHLPAVIEDLNRMAEELGGRARLYQLLGDAYMQSDQLNEALEAYRRARQALVKH